jgi:hypothetical protein
MTLRAQNHTRLALLLPLVEIFNFTSQSNVLHPSLATKSAKDHKEGTLILDTILHTQKDMSFIDSGRISRRLVTLYAQANLRVSMVKECLSTLYRECVPTW